MRSRASSPKPATTAVHVTDLDLNGAADDDVLAAAADIGRIVVTADTDFGTLLALRKVAGPSVILLRRQKRRATRCRETHPWVRHHRGTAY